MAKISPVADTEGLSQHELVALGHRVMQNSFISQDGVSAYKIKEDDEQCRLYRYCCKSCPQKPLTKGMIITNQRTDFNGNVYLAFDVTPVGAEWLLRNQDLLVLRAKNLSHILMMTWNHFD